MTKTYKISKKQSLLDACIQVYGTAQLLYTLAKDNGLSIDSAVDIGDELTYDEALGVPKMKKALIRENKDVLNEGDSVASPVFNDYFLPSQDLATEMQTKLKAFGVGGFNDGDYWTSSETTSLAVKYIRFLDGFITNALKSTAYNVRACRSFEAAIGAYALRDVGPAGGLVFWTDGAGNYVEAAPVDQSAAQAWSNITNVLIGTTDTAIGTGQANTADIIAQPGHTDSAAKLCNDLIISN